MDLEPLESEDGLPIAFAQTIGKPEGLFLSPSDYKTITAAISTAANDGVDMRDVGMSLPVLASPADSWDLAKLLQRAFEGISIPQVTNLEEKAISLWCRGSSSKSGYLFKGLDPVTRMIKGRSFLLAAPLISIWPPPITLNTTRESAVIWSLELTDEDREIPALRTIRSRLAQDYMGYFFAVVSNDPNPSKSYI
jgi:hypothetical protein